MPVSVRLLCRAVLAVTGDHLTNAEIPEWTAYVGQEWDTYDVAPWNLYNVLWRGQQLLFKVEAEW